MTHKTPDLAEFWWFYKSHFSHIMSKFILHELSIIWNIWDHQSLPYKKSSIFASFWSFGESKNLCSTLKLFHKIEISCFDLWLVSIQFLDSISTFGLLWSFCNNSQALRPSEVPWPDQASSTSDHHLDKVFMSIILTQTNYHNVVLHSLMPSPNLSGVDW